MTHQIEIWIAECLLPLAFWILVSGLDDLILNIVCLWQWIADRFRKSAFAPPTEAELASTAERPIAIFVPLWKEHRVIGRMVEHNIGAVRYGNYHFFIGAYPNDQPTIDVIRGLESRFPNVHLAMTANPGPTSKADCLNWIYQRMLAFEAENGIRFGLILTHDAEDIIHSEAMRWINFYARNYDMIQIPVLPLETPFWKLTHGIYCDEFSECHTRDMRARQFFNAFIPSCGVGTGFVRPMLERLAAESGSRIFEPVCLTEDYENGIRLHNMGAKQLFVPITKRNGSFVATREFFPQKFRSAVKQRTRWVTGISLQTWERHGWRGNLVQKYWLWRDRKGLVGNPVSVVTSSITLYGIGTWVWSKAQNVPWTFGQLAIPTDFTWLFQATFVLGLLQLFVRAFCVGRICGPIYALGVPLRVLHANVINSAATLSAIKRYFVSRWKKQPLVWLKTEHAYPTHGALASHRREFSEILIDLGYVSAQEVSRAKESKPDSVRLGAQLVRLGLLTEDQLYHALSVQHSLPVGRIAVREVRPNVARALPAQVIRSWRVLPVRVESGSLMVASPEVPTEEMQTDLRRFTSLDLQFQLITPGNFAELATELL